MLRRAFLLAFALFLVQETDLGSLLVGADCAEACPEDSTPGRCPPTCATCSCGTHLSSVAPPTMRLAAPASRDGRPSFQGVVVPADRHVGEIRHVPKPVLS